MRRLLSICTMLLLASGLYAQSVDPGVLNIKLYKMAISTSTDCTNLQTIFSDPTPNYTNVLDSPTFGQAEIANGTYPCVVFDMSDTIQFTAATAIGDGSVCTTNTTYTLDVCNGGDPTILIDGTTATCSSAEDIAGLYLTTSVTTDNARNVFQPPTESNSGGVLLNPMTVNGDVIGSFVVDGSGKVSVFDDGGTDICEMGKPDFDFVVE